MRNARGTVRRRAYGLRPGARLAREGLRSLDVSVRSSPPDVVANAGANGLVAGLPAVANGSSGAPEPTRLLARLVSRRNRDHTTILRAIAAGTYPAG